MEEAVLVDFQNGVVQHLVPQVGYLTVGAGIGDAEILFEAFDTDEQGACTAVVVF